MKVVINADFGGFGLSAEAIEMYLKRKGKECYWFRYEWSRTSDDPHEGKYIPITKEMAEKEMVAMSYTTPEPSDETHFTCRDIERNDPDLVAVVEELKDAAGHRYARLRIVEIPDDVEWQIEEYDGSEWVAEKHRTWR